MLKIIFLRLNMDKTKDKLDGLFNLIFKIPKSKEKKNLNYKNIKKWDSLNHLNLMLAIESKFNIRIMPEESVDLMSYKKIPILSILAPFSPPVRVVCSARSDPVEHNTFYTHFAAP